MTKKTYLITGATGFLGRHVIEHLISKREDITPLALVRDDHTWNSYDWTKNLNSVQTIHGSVTNISDWENDPRLKNLSGIYHLAAVVRHSRENAEDVYHTNIEGTLNMVRLAAKAKCRIVFVSTSGTVGCFNSEKEWADEHSPYCQDKVASWPYYDSKIQAEQKAQKLAKELGVDLIIIRPPAMLGPGDHRFRATGHILRLLRGKLPFLIKGGIHFIDIRDAAEAMIRAMGLTNPKPIYHLDGTACSITDFFKMVHEVSGVAPPKFLIPSGIARVAAKSTQKIERFRTNKSSTLLPDPVVIEMASKYWDVRSNYAKEELGYESRKPVETLRDTVQWILKNHEAFRHTN